MTTMTAACTPSKSRRSLFATLGSRFALLRTRRHLKQLDAKALEDIGISRTEAAQEAGRSFWDAPRNWRC